MPKEQLTIQPLDGYAPSVGYALACLEWERTKTHEVIADLSREGLDARAEGFPNSVGSLLYHIALVELDWLYSEILEQPIPEAFEALFPLEHRDEDGHLAVMAGAELGEHLARLATVRRALLEKLKDMTDEDFYRARQLEPYDVNPAWVLYHLLEHEAKHSAQMALLRGRLEDGTGV